MKTFVIHCDSCCIFVEKSERDFVDCPQEKNGPVDGFPQINMASLRGTEFGSKKDGSIPYFDESLDQRIYSKKHKQEVLNEKGWVQVDSGKRKGWRKEPETKYEPNLN